MSTEFEVLQNRVRSAFQKGGESAEQALDRLVEQGMSMRDHLVSLSALTIGETGEGGQGISAVFGSELNMVSGTLHDNAIAQLAGRLDIPSGYLKKLANGAKWQTGLAASTANTFLENTEDKKLLLRSVGGQIRAVLSDKYRRLNNVPIFTGFAKAASSQGARIYNAHLSELRMYMEVVHPEVVQVPTEKNGIINFLVGAQVSSSDFGAGSLEVKSFMVNVACLNGMVGRRMMREVHLGRRIQEDDMAFSERTYSLDTETMASAVADLAKHAFSEEQRLRIMDSVQKSANKERDPEAVVKELPNMGIMKNEVEDIKSCLYTSSEGDGVTGAVTNWKVAQAITAVARQAEPERMREMQTVAGELVGLN